MQASYRTVFDAYLRIFARLRARRDPGGGRVRRHRRRRQPRVHGAVGGGGGPLRARARPAATPPTWRPPPAGASATPSRPDGRTPRADRRAPHPRPSRHRRRGGLLRRPGRSDADADLLKSLAVVDAEGRAVLLLLPGRPRGPAAAAGGACSRTRTSPPTPRWSRGTSARSASRTDGIRVVGRRRGGPSRPVDHRAPTGPTTTSAGRCSAATSTVDEWGSFAEVVPRRRLSPLR